MSKMIWAGASLAAGILLLLAALWLFFFLRNPPGQIGWWKLDQSGGATVRDSSRLFGHNGKIIYKGFEWVEGPHDHALQLDGRSHVLLGNIYQGSYDQMSIACWIKHSSTGWQSIVERGVWDDPDGIGLWADYSGQGVTFGHYASAQLKSQAVVQDDKWHHVAGTLAKSGDAYLYSIYVDGKLDNTMTNSIGLEATTNPWSIGARYTGEWAYTGQVSDVRIFNRALTPAEVRRLYKP